MKIILAMVTVFFIVFFNTVAGVRNVDPDLVNAVWLMGGSARQIQGVVFTTQDEIDKKRAAIAGFIRGYAKANTTILKDPARSRELLKGFYPNLDQRALDLTLDVYRSTSVSSNPMPSEVGFLRAIKFHQAAGLITEPYSYNDIVATKAIADAIAKR